MSDPIELGEDGAWYADWGERWESDEALIEDWGDMTDEEWEPEIGRAVAAARRRIAEREREAERTPGTKAYQERVEAEGQMRLVP